MLTITSRAHLLSLLYDSTLDMVNYYQILGIPLFSEPPIAKQAYKTLAKKYHPDKNPGSKTAEEKFKEVNKAYQVLSDPDKKARYDNLLRGYQKIKNFSSNAASRKRYRQAFHSTTSPGRMHTVFQGLASIGLMLFVCSLVWLFGSVNSLLLEQNESRNKLDAALVLEQIKVYLDQEDFKSAIETLEKQKNQLPTDSFTLMKEKVLNNLYGSALIDFSSEDYKEAQQKFVLLIKHKENILPEQQFMLAESYRKNKEYSEAVNILLKAANQWEETAAWSYFQIGEIYFNKLQVCPRAEKYYELSLTSGSPPALKWISTDSILQSQELLYHHLSLCYRDKEQYQKIIELLTKKKFHSSHVYLLLIEAYCKTGNTEKACQLHQKFHSNHTTDFNSNKNCCKHI